MEWIMTVHSVISESQLTNSMIFQRGRYTTNQNCLGAVFYLGFNEEFDILLEGDKKSSH